MKFLGSKLVFCLTVFIVLSSEECDFGNNSHIRCGTTQDEVFFTSQLQIDTFRKSLPNGCNCFMGTLRILGNHKFDYQALDFLRSIGGFKQSLNNSIGIQNGFNKLDTIYGDLEFSSSTLSAVKAFAKLKFVGGDLRFSRVKGLDSLTGFNSLLEIKSLIFSSSSFSKIDAFNNCRIINQTMSVTENSELKMISDFSCLEKVKGNISIHDNPVIKHLNGFNKLEGIGKINITKNKELKDISGFNSVRELETLSINDHPTLESVTGFRYLSKITLFGLFISSNSELNSLAGFKNLTNISRAIVIKNNPKLIACCTIYPALKAANTNTLKTIENNGTNCNSPDEIIVNGSCK